MDYALHINKSNTVKLHTKIMLAIILISGLVFALSAVKLQSAHAAVDTCTWTGSVNGSWSNGANWTGCDNGGVPEDGDALVFPNSAGNKTNNNDISGLDLTGIEYDGDNYNTSGSAINLTGSTTNVIDFDGDNNAHGIPTTITASSSKIIVYTGADNTIVSSLVLAFSSGDMNFMAGSPGVELTISSVISGTTGIFIVSPDSHLNLTGNNTFDKLGITVNANSILNCESSGCFGNYTSDDPITIFGDGLLILDSAITVDENITFQTGTNSPGHVLVSQDATLEGDFISITSGVVTLENTTTLTMNGNTNIGSGSNILFIGDENYTDNVIDFNDAFIGNGTAAFTNIHATLDAASSSFSGGVVANAGSLIDPSNANAFGNTTSGTTIKDGATIFVNSLLTFPEHFTITGAGIGAGDYVGAIVGDTTSSNFDDITLDGDATIANQGSGFTVGLQGVIDGTGDLTLQGSDGSNTPFEIGGSGGADDSVDNSYVGHTYVQEARVILDKNPNTNAIPGDISVIAGTNTANIFDQQDEQIPDDAIVSVDSALSLGLFVLTGGITETVGSVFGDGTIQVGSTSDELFVGGGNKSGVFTGSLSAPTGSVVTKIGTGTWNFQGKNVNLGSGYGDYEIAGGKFLANPSDTSLENSDFSVTSTGTIGGNGNVGAIDAQDGSIAPGDSPGCLYPAGPVSLESNSSFDVEINGSTPCSGYDQLNGGDSVTINGAQLNVNVGYVPVTGTQYTIIDADSVSGTFAGLADGSTFVAGGRNFEIDYTSTSVVLTDRGVNTTTIPAPGVTGVLSVTGVQALATLVVSSLVFLVGGILLYRRRKPLLV